MAESGRICLEYGHSVSDVFEDHDHRRVPQRSREIGRRLFPRARPERSPDQARVGTGPTALVQGLCQRWTPSS